MKKVLSVALVAMMALVGCKTVPTQDKMYATSYSVGCASGMVVNETKVDDKTRDTIIEVVSIAKEVAPAEGRSFQETWVPFATEYTDTLVRAGRLDPTQATIVVGGVTIASAGLDYVFNAYPKARTYEELVSAAVNGFSTGFLTTFKPSNADTRSISADYDKDAYLYLKSRFIKE